MSYQYDTRRRGNSRPAETHTIPRENAVPGMSMDALMTGAAKPTAAQKGRSFDLNSTMKAKMEHAFGDLSAVKFYQSQAVADAGAEAVAQGNEIAFAPGKTDFNTKPGQERLGHELSHVISQQRGRVRGQGFLANSALEAQADREGARAAAGEQLYGGAIMPLSDASAASAVGPMQAKCGKNDIDPELGKPKRKVLMDQTVEEDAEGYDQLDPSLWELRKHDQGFFDKLRGKKPKYYKAKIDRRPWEMSREELQKNRFNPNNVSELRDIQEKISTAGKDMTAHAPDGVSQEDAQNGYNNRSAWMAFQKYNEAGDDDIHTLDDEGADWDMNEVDNAAFTTKLKNMSRMVYDYPELNDNIGPLVSLDQKKRQEMKEKHQAERNQTATADTTGKKLRQRLKRKKGTGSVKLQPAPAPGFQPNLAWQQDDAVDPDWVEDAKKKDKNSSTTVMSAHWNDSYSSGNGYQLSINAGLEGKSNEARKKRRDINKKLTEQHGTTLDYAANHELGHMLNYALVKELNRGLDSRNKVNRKGKEIKGTSDRDMANTADVAYHVTANRLVERALKETMKKEDFEKLVRYKEDSLHSNEAWDPSVKLEKDEEWDTENMDERFKAGQINLQASGLGATKDNRGYTTEYGATNASEFFAEAFADVYQNGKEARPTSIRLVQIYEEEMENAKQKNKKLGYD